MQNRSVTGIILAGGENKRFNGHEKAFMRIHGKCIIEHILDSFGAMFDEIIVVTNSPIPYLQWNVNIVKDIFDMRSSLTGVHAGLFYTRTPHAFITACDTPFVSPGLVAHLLQTVQPRDDVVIPQTRSGLEPLCAVYSKRCLPLIQQQMLRKQMKISAFFNNVRLKTVAEDMLRSIDPELLSFFNINSPANLEIATRLFHETPPGEQNDIK